MCLFVCLHVSYAQKLKRDEIVFHYNNTYKYNVEYVVDVDKHTEYIMEFAGDEKAYDTPARVTVASDFANRTYPLFITARQQKGVFSWQLPMLIQTPMSLEQFNNISRTLCPHNNLYNEDEESCDVTTINTPIVHLTSASPEPIRVTIVVESVLDFYIVTNKTTNMTVTPSQPKYYFYPFKQNPELDLHTQKIKKKYKCNEELDHKELISLDRYFLKSNALKRQYSWLTRPKSVIVMIESDDDICAVVSIQNFSCPVFDNERDILYDGYYLTMTRRGGITLTQDMFPLGFYIVFIVKSSDDDCVMGGVSDVNVSRITVRWQHGKATATSDDGRVKTFSFRIIETISYREYLIAAGAVLGFFMSFYAGFAIVVVYQRVQGLRRSDSDTLDSSEEGRSTPPTASYDDTATQTTRRRVVNAMSASVESTSRQSDLQQRLVGDGDAREGDTVERDVVERDVVDRDVVERDVVERDVVERDVAERNVMERHVAERDVVERDVVERDVVERDVLKRDTVERDVVERDVMEGDAVECNLVERDVVDSDVMTRNVMERDAVERDLVECDGVECDVIGDSACSQRIVGECREHQQII
ncbi:hypothetical protein O0L34_g12078 [Tuta absoluta]|nr:hypothetical protein O0L34_g12078 [Tuta absoluta]